MDLRERYARCRERYARCQRYADSGAVAQGGKPWCRFETRFERAREVFCFRATLEDGDMFAIDAEGARVELTLPPALLERVGDPFLGHPGTLDLAIAALTGVSGGSIAVLADLLMPGRIDLAAPFDPQRFEVAETGLVVRFVLPELESEIMFDPTLDD